MMSSSRLPQLVLVEDVGGDRSPFAAIGYLPSAERVCVLPTPDGDAKSLEEDILRSIGKRGRRPRLRTSRASQLSLRTWLFAEGIADIFVGGADHLTGEQLDFLDETSHDCRIWLLFERLVPAYVSHHWSQLETATAKPQSLSEFQRKTPVDGGIDWSDFPSLPLHREILFRGRCKRLFDDVSMTRIDLALVAGANHARGELRRSSATAEEVARPGLDPTVPTWPALAMLRGCQLGALSSGHVLDFNVRNWLQVRRAVGEFDAVQVAALRESVDPTASSLAVLHVSTAAPAATLANLLLEDLNHDASSVRVQDSIYAVPDPIRATLRARRRISEEAGTSALFSEDDGTTLDHLRAQKLLVAELKRLGLPSSTESVLGGSRRGRRDTFLSPLIELKLRELPHVASR